MTGFFAFFLPVYKNGFNSSKYSLCLTCCLKDLLPKNTEVMHIKRKPKYRKKLESTQIFKDGLYGERFMSILLDSGGKH
jgi:hypothetical protein